MIAGEVIVLFISICFLLDGFNRIRKSIKMGEVICKKTMVIILTAYSLEFVECIGFLVGSTMPLNDFNVSHPLFYPIVSVLFRLFFCIGTTILASILYKLGEDQAAAKTL